MIGQLSGRTPVIVQGATGRAGSVHVRRMKQYGTNIVAGVSARGAGTTVEGVPVLPTAVPQSGRPAHRFRCLW
jgi:succinyl-CoA synthetase alpha subunit